MSSSRERVFALDLLRGLDMFLLCCVGGLVRRLNAAAGCLPDGFMEQFNHRWTGFRLWDLIMPLFIFMCGAAVPMALGRRMEEGRPTAAYWKRVLVRIAMLWALGMLVQGDLLTLDPQYVRYYSNTLQAIAVGYLVSALVLPVRRWTVRAAVPLALLAAYGLLLHFGGDYSKTGNLAMRIDRAVFSCLVPAGNPALTEPEYTWILPSLTFAALSLFGMLSTQLLSVESLPKARRGALLALAGATLVVAGAVVSIWVPVIKPISTVSFNLYAAGWSMLLLAVLYLVTDVLGWRRGLGVFILYGQTALTAYLVAEFFYPETDALIAHLTQGFGRFMAPAWKAFAGRVVYVVLLTGFLWTWRRMKRRSA